jgi:hypothetical protein
MGVAKGRWIAEREFLMDDIFERGIHCVDCKHKIRIPAEDMSGEGHYMEPQRECEVQGDPESCPGVKEEWYDGIYADRYFPT